MFRRNALIVTLLILGLTVLATACKKPQPTVTPEPQQVEEPAPPPPPPPKKVEDEGWKQEEPTPAPVDLNKIKMEVQAKLATVYFDFDRYDLDDADRATLQANAQVMKDNPSMNFLIEGHCDERGTIEYNLALGERRANSVREYLASLGVASSRLRIKSYGEERPAVPGSNEAAWAKNRRAEFKVD